MRSGDKSLNFEEISGQFQGDIILTKQQEQVWLGLERTGLINTTYRWPQNTIPYALSSVFNEAQLAHINRGLREIEEATCLKFVLRTTESNYVDVTVSSSYFLFKMCCAYSKCLYRVQLVDAIHMLDILQVVANNLIWN